MIGRFEEQEHPRAGKGSAEGGRFVSKGGGGKAGKERRSVPKQKPVAAATVEDIWSDYDLGGLVKEASKGTPAKAGDMVGGAAIDKATADQVNEAATQLQRMASNELSKHTEVWRGVAYPVGTDVKALFKRNALVTFQGLTATSADRGVAEKYTDAQFIGEETGVKVLLRIGRRGKLVGHDNNAGELAGAETILAHGAQFRVAGMRVEGDTTVVDLYDKGTLNQLVGDKSHGDKYGVVKADIREGPMPSQSAYFLVKQFAKPDAQTEVLINPKFSDVVKFTKATANGVRAMRDAAGNLYIWDAQAGLHGNLVDSIEKTSGKSIFTDEFKDKDEWVLEGNKFMSWAQLDNARPPEWIAKGQANAKKAGPLADKARGDFITLAENAVSKYRKEAKPLVKEIADREGFKGKITFTELPPDGDRYAYAQHFGKTGDIEFYDNAAQLGRDAIRGIAAHEVQHAKWTKVMTEWASGKHNELNKYFTEPYFKVGADKFLEKMMKSGAKVSPYAKEYWQRDAFKSIGQSKNITTFAQAFNETLAEVARLREMGQTKTIAPEWNTLYDTIDRLYKKGR